MGQGEPRRRGGEQKRLFSHATYFTSRTFCAVQPCLENRLGTERRGARADGGVGQHHRGSPRQKSHEWGPNAPSPPFRVGDSLPRCWGSTGRILAHDHEPCACPVPPAARGRGRRWARTRPRCSPAVPRTWKLNMLSKHGEQTEGLSTGLCVGTQGGARLGAALLCAHILLAAASGAP